MREIVKEQQVTIAAATAAICGVFLGYPFDSLKTRMQAFKYSSPYDCTLTTYRQEGIRGFYRGVAPVLISTTLFRAISFRLYHFGKNLTQGWFNTNPTMNVILSSAISGGFTGGIVAIVSAPLEFVKVQRQLEVLKSSSNSINNPTLYHWMKYIYQNHGFSAFYRGGGLLLFRDFVGTGYYFAAYEAFKFTFSTTLYSAPLVHLLGGGIAGTSVWLLLFPIDLCKSIIQREALSKSPKFTSTFQLINHRYTKHGISGFYRGLQPQLVRAFPVHAVNFLVYEHMLKVIASL